MEFEMVINYEKIWCFWWVAAGDFSFSEEMLKVEGWALGVIQ